MIFADHFYVLHFSISFVNFPSHLSPPSSLGWPESLDSVLLCIVDSVYDASLKNCISFAKEWTSKDKEEF